MQWVVVLLRSSGGHCKQMVDGNSLKFAVLPSSQCSLHNAPIFRLLLKVAVNGTHQCESLNFCGTSVPIIEHSASGSMQQRGAGLADSSPEIRMSELRVQPSWLLGFKGLGLFGFS